MKLVPLAVATACIALHCSPLAAQGIDYSKLEIKTTDLGSGVYLLNWQGGDSLILVGDDGVLLVDTSVAAMGDKIEAAIAKVSGKPIKLIVNTHAHADHFGANEALAKGGATIVAHATLRERMANGFTAFNQPVPPAAPAALPTVIYDDAMTLHFDGETVQLIHPANAHTDSDTLVHFERANVIHASGTIGGDGGYVFFDSGSGGSLAGTIAAEDKMLSLADDKTRIVADEGDPASTAMLRAQRDMLVTLRARVQKSIDEGKSEDEAVAAKPTKDFDAQFVHQGNFLNGDAMTRLAYQSLKSAGPPTEH
ncbi:MAG TPA: MBL fold metallo-hydrolase [Gammaproteobacteria bacterium]|nr:MBL fold metallo-hydrolase [Gammaproteobacteria bacterium]